jgi:hypothetical protein
MRCRDRCRRLRCIRVRGHYPQVDLLPGSLTERNTTVNMARNNQTTEVGTVSEERRRRWSVQEKAPLVK